MARPAKYTEPEQIEQKFDEYLKVCEAGQAIPFVTKRGDLINETLPICPSLLGFALHLGFTKIETLDQYSQKSKFKDVVSRVRAEIHKIRDIYSERGIIEPQIARMDYAKRNNLVDSKHEVTVNINTQLREALQSSKKAQAKLSQSNDN